MLKPAYDKGVDWLIGLYSNRGNLCELTAREIFKIFEACWNQKYEPEDLITHLINRWKYTNRNSDKWRASYEEPYQEREATREGQLKHIKPLMKNYCSCQIAYGIVNFMISYVTNYDKWGNLQKANLSYLTENILKFGNGYLCNIPPHVTDEKFNSIYAFFQADIKDTKENVDWKSALTDCIPDIASGNKIFCPFHVDVNRPNIELDKYSWTENKWKCNACGIIGQFPTLIMKVTGKDWYELKPKYLRKDEAKQIDVIPQENIVPVKQEKIDSDIELKPLSKDHWIITERGFDWNHLISFGCKETSREGAVYLPYINRDGVEVGYHLRHTPEYLESNPESGKYMVKKGFSNGNHLFGINKVVDTNPLIIVEGSLDTIALNYFGYNSVAVVSTVPSGMSQLQFFELLKLNPQEVCLAYDNDEIGKKGTEKAMEILAKTNLNISVIKFHDEHNDFGDIKDKDIIDLYISNRSFI